MPGCPQTTLRGCSGATLDPLIQPLRLPDYDGDIQLKVIRGDLIHPQISGNKWYKLYYNLRLAQHFEARAILSFGGAWSNHIHALAAAGSLCQLPTIGVIRGQWRQRQLTATLQDAEQWGMRLVFVAKDQYRNRSDLSWIASQLPQWLGQTALPPRHHTDNSAAQCTAWLPKQYTNRLEPLSQASDCQMINGVSIVPEGGSNPAGIAGIRAWARAIYAVLRQPTTIIMPVGSGGTLAGFASEPSPHQLVGIPVLRAGDGLRQQITALLNRSGKNKSCTRWTLKTGYEFGGYGRYPDTLKAFSAALETASGLPVDPVYNARSFYGLRDMLQKHTIRTRQAVIIHTGGLQGKRGFC